MSDRLWLPSLNALRAFEATARHESFQKAANELHVTSPAIQQLVRGLEDALAASLVVRRGRAITVTEAGERGLGHLRDGFDLIAKGVGLIRSYCPSRQLRVSVEPSFASAWLIGRLASFQAANPSVDVLLETSERLANLAAGEADIAIRYGTPPWPGLGSRRLFDDETVAVCSPLMPNKPAEFGDLARATLIRFERAKTMQPGWDAWLAPLGAAPPRAGRTLRFTDYTMMLQAAVGGQGIALVSRPIVRQALDAGLLVTLFGRSVRPGFGYHVVTASHAPKRPEAAAFIRWIEEEVSVSPVLQTGSA